MTEENQHTPQDLSSQIAAYRSMHQCFREVSRESQTELKGRLICDQFKQMAGAVFTCLFLYEPKSECFICRATDSTADKTVINGTLVYNDDELTITDFQLRAEQKNDISITLNGTIPAAQPRSYAFDDKYIMFLPIIRSNTPCAIMLAEFNEPLEINDDFDRQLIEDFFIQADSVLKCIVETKKLHEKAGHLQLLYDIGHKLSDIRSEDQLLETILSLIEENVQVDRCSLMIMDSDGKTMRIKKAIGMDNIDISKIKVRIGEGIAGHVADSKRPLLIKDICTDTLLNSQTDKKKQYNTNSLLSVPLIAQQKVIGVINVNNRKDGRPFMESDRALLCKIGSEIAVILQRSYMALQLKKAKELDKDINRYMV